MKRLLVAIAMMVGFASAAAACPNWNLAAGESYSASGSQLRSPKFFDVIAGGSNYIWNCPGINPQSDRGAGYFPSNPDFRFQLSNMGGTQLVVSVVSRCDAALLINTASATWYYDDDDNGNLDPRIVLTRPANGQIDIWIGTYDGEYCDAQLRMETFAR
ncbi:hypothetical protein [Aestuariibius sp. HNIBRBA575]|uniref:hypothetical protein n=1 Tax=Aestuariibius sp. HNIBRBA575 TaxID=3233343 RepID=UPI0034A5357A